MIRGFFHTLWEIFTFFVLLFILVWAGIAFDLPGWVIVLGVALCAIEALYWRYGRDG